MTEVSLNPTSGDRLIRNRGRVQRLAQAIQKESSKASPDAARLAELQAEYDVRMAELAAFVEGIPDA